MLDGRSVLANYHRQVLLHRHNFGSRVRAAKFSPDGRFIAVTHERFIQFWKTPSLSYEFASFALHRTVAGPYDDVTCMNWSIDSTQLVVGSRDLTVRIFAPDAFEGFQPSVLTGHRDVIVSVWFSDNGRRVISVARDGSCFIWKKVEYGDERNGAETHDDSKEIRKKRRVEAQGKKFYDRREHTWVLENKYYFNQGHSKVSCADYNYASNLLVVGFHSGVFGIWDLAEFSNVQILRPDGKQLAVATLEGIISLWDIDLGRQDGYIDGRADIVGGRLQSSGSNVKAESHFTSISYSSDGTCLLAGGTSKYVCLFKVQNSFLLKKFQVTENLSLDGMHRVLDSRNMTEAGSKALLDVESDEDTEKDRSLPGVRNGDMSLRRAKIAALTRCVRFSPTGMTWAAASSEGLVLFSLDESLMFDPFDLELEITPETIIEELLERSNYSKALSMAFRLGELSLEEEVFHSIPSSEASLVMRAISHKHLHKFMKLLIHACEKELNLQKNLQWLSIMLKSHGRYIRERSEEFSPTLRALTKTISGIMDSLGKTTNDSYVVLANGAAGGKKITDIDSEDYKIFEQHLLKISVDISKLIVRDGEGDTKFVEIKVQVRIKALRGANSLSDAKQVASTVAKSPLVKTAIYGKDANWGRIICAVGYSGIKVNPQAVSLKLSGKYGLSIHE
ncbi:hypothetical protein HDU96_009620 [Phlyctochytrium bullatum]|nr:hypothetical protein HDU96_009620 [Phlyctochytrium bullatum]